jgi:hypothetical protein
MKFRHFTNSDWHGLAGSERFLSGETPLINEEDEYVVVVNEHGVPLSGKMFVVLDKEGIALIGFEEPDETIAIEEIILPWPVPQLITPATARMVFDRLFPTPASLTVRCDVLHLLGARQL